MGNAEETHVSHVCTPACATPLGLEVDSLPVTKGDPSGSALSTMKFLDEGRDSARQGDQRTRTNGPTLPSTQVLLTHNLALTLRKAFPAFEWFSLSQHTMIRSLQEQQLSMSQLNYKRRMNHTRTSGTGSASSLRRGLRKLHQDSGFGDHAQTPHTSAHNTTNINEPCLFCTCWRDQLCGG